MLVEMNWYTTILILLLAAICIWLRWQLVLLRKKLIDLTNAIPDAENSKENLDDLPRDVPLVEDLSNAIHGLAENMAARIHEAESGQQKLAAIIERMSDGVIIADNNGIVNLINPAANRFFNSRDAVGKSVAEVIRHHQLVETWHRSRESGTPQEESIEIPLTGHFLRLVIQPDLQSGDTLLLVQDLTRLRRLEKVRQDFISNVSHELRTPLASLKALSETLRDGALNDHEAAPRFLERIETEVDALTQMAQELLDLSRIESGQVNLDLKGISPGKLLKSVVERMNMQAERAGLNLSVDASPDLPNIQGDRIRLEQVLVNLVHNAVKFTQPGGSISLHVDVDSGMMCFSVQDTGVGIPSDELERVFERFYKADRARSGGGTGLGLSIARHIVEAHGGQIGVKSIEGQGSTFYFIIPIK
jgi:two-component system, OmpR family, phosphate regulon sensor histidine kinase PhoR